MLAVEVELMRAYGARSAVVICGIHKHHASKRYLCQLRRNLSMHVSMFAQFETTIIPFTTPILPFFSTSSVQQRTNQSRICNHRGVQIASAKGSVQAHQHLPYSP